MSIEHRWWIQDLKAPERCICAVGISQLECISPAYTMLWALSSVLGGKDMIYSSQWGGEISVLYLLLCSSPDQFINIVLLDNHPTLFIRYEFYQHHYVCNNSASRKYQVFSKLRGLARVINSGLQPVPPF